MKLLVKGKNVDVNSSIQEYAEKRLGKLGKQLDQEVTRLELEIAQERNPSVDKEHVAEVTIWTKGPTLRAREASHDVFASIDLVAEKLAQQVRKHREKRIQQAHGRKPRRNSDAKAAAAEAHYEFVPSSLSQGDAPMAVADIVKTKQFLLDPMSPEDAALQMDLLGHDFFMFVHDESQDTCVIYRRREGGYGVIEPTRTE